MGDVKSMDEFRAGSFAARVNEIHQEIVNDLIAKGLDPNGPPEWDDYRDAQPEPGKLVAAPSPAYQEAYRRARQEFPNLAAGMDRLAEEGDDD